MTRTVTTLSVTEMPVATGNWDSTRTPIDRVIIHTIVGTIASAASRFNTPGTGVSAHYGVSLTGSLVHWVDETNTAYQSGDYPTNQRSIGIEHEDNGDYNGVRPDVLYAASARLVNDICNFYQIPIDRIHILKHSEVSDAPTSCPDALDIDRIVSEASALNVPVPPVPPIIPVPTDKTTYDFGAPWGVLEMGAIRSKLNDMTASISSLTQANNQQVNLINSLTQQLATAQNATNPVPVSTSTTPTPVPSTNSFLSWLQRLLGIT